MSRGGPARRLWLLAVPNTAPLRLLTTPCLPLLLAAKQQEIIHVDTSLGMLERARSHAEASSSGRVHPPTRYLHWQPDSEVLPLEPASADCEHGRNGWRLQWLAGAGFVSTSQPVVQVVQE